MEGGCQKSAKNLPIYLKFHFEERFAMRESPYGPQVAEEKKKSRFSNFFTDSLICPKRPNRIPWYTTYIRASSTYRYERGIRTPSEKKIHQNWTNKQKTIFWQQERTHTDFLVDKNAFTMARFGCKMARKSKTQNCHLCYFLRIPRSYIRDNTPLSITNMGAIQFFHLHSRKKAGKSSACAERTRT